MRAGGVAVVAAMVLAACGDSSGEGAGRGAGDGGSDGGAAQDTAVVRHAFEPFALGAGEERTPCLSWTLENEEALWVQGVTLDNDGFYHHSNWFVVPEDRYPGPDGFWDCADRGFDQVTAAISGTVLAAQSTQSRHEEQRFPEGTVVKIPPRHKVVAGGHLLNTSSLDVDTVMRVALDIVHPSRVRTVLTPFHLDYRALDIPPQTDSRFSMSCDLAAAAADVGRTLDLKIRYVLPHFHYLGNYWSLEIVGGPQDGQVVHELSEGFAGDAGGVAFDPAVDLSGANGLKMTCGFRNPRDESVGWGIGDQEMCEMLGLAESPVLYDAAARTGNEVVGTEGGVVMNEAPCEVMVVPRNAAQAPPTAEELEAGLYVPPSDDPGVVVTPECVDTPPDAEARPPVTLAGVSEEVFQVSCAFNACHAGPDPAAGLSLDAEDLHAELTGHAVQAHESLPLVAPGDPEGSFLYRRISRCEPTDGRGNVLPHMPLNNPRLLDPSLVAKVRDWIAAGAADD